MNKSRHFEALAKHEVDVLHAYQKVRAVAGKEHRATIANSVVYMLNESAMRLRRVEADNVTKRNHIQATTPN